MNNGKPVMHGSIVKRGRSYLIKVSLGKDPASGKYLTKYYTVKGTRKDAERIQREILTQLDKGIYIDPGKVTVTEYLHQWLTEYAKPKLSPRGFERYRDIINHHFIPEFGNIKLVDLSPEHIQKHYQSKQDAGLSSATVRYHHAVIHKALATAIKRGLLNRNAADGADIPKLKTREFETWSQDEVAQFLNAAKDSYYYALFHTALFTGMRRSELLALRWIDIDLFMATISVSRGLHHLKDGSYVITAPKSDNSRRTVALSPAAVIALRNHKDRQSDIYAALDTVVPDDALVFTSAKGEPLRPNTITRAWVTIAKRAGVKVIRLHDARHTHATLMLRANIHPKVVQERLGHSSITITLDRYSHVSPDIQRAAAQRFDKLLSTSFTPTSENEAIGKH